MCNYKNNEPDQFNDSVPKFNLDLMPEYQKRLLAEFALELTRDVFSRPGEEERYQAWLASRQKREKP